MSNNKSIIISDEAGLGHWQMVEKDDRGHFNIRPPFERPRIHHKAFNMPGYYNASVPLDIVLMVLEKYIYPELMESGDYKSLFKAVFSSKTILVRFYYKFIGNNPPKSFHNLYGRVSNLFGCMQATITMLRDQDHHPPQTPDENTQTYVIQIAGFGELNDWNENYSWPWCYPGLVIQPLQRTYTKCMTPLKGLICCVDGPKHLNETWLLPETIEDRVIKTCYFRSPVVSFSCVDILDGSDFNTHFNSEGKHNSESIKVWVKFLKVFLGPDAGVYTSIQYSTGEYMNVEV